MRGLRYRRHRSLVNSVSNGPIKWNTVTYKDQKMVDEGWHRFWARRGMEPPTEPDFCFTDKERKKQMVGVDTK